MRCSAVVAILAATFAAAYAAADEPALAKLLRDLTAANEARDVGRITGMLKRIDDAVQKTKDRAAVDVLAGELVNSLKVCKRKLGALGEVVDTLGGLRSKKGEGALKRLAFKKDAKDEQAEDLQSRALVALGRSANPRLLNGIADQTKNRSNTIAKGAYVALGSYGSARGRTRKKAAEFLIKRLAAEAPSYGGSSGKRVSAAKRERWGKVRASINSSLQAACHESAISGAEDWKEWWRDHKANPKTWRDKKEAD